MTERAEDDAKEEAPSFSWLMTPEEAARSADREIMKREMEEAARKAERSAFLNAAALAALQGIGTWVPGHQHGMTDAEGMKARAEWCYRQAHFMLLARES